jgi:hypothetical protein
VKKTFFVSKSTMFILPSKSPKAKEVAPFEAPNVPHLTPFGWSIFKKNKYIEM